MSKHLWDVKHPYYCNEGNYFTTHDRVCSRFKSWADFLSEFGAADFDMNLLFRWDWEEIDPETEKPNFNNNVNYRNGVFKAFWMGQRKGLYQFSLVEVCRADEPAVLEFLRPRWVHLQRLWAPLTEVTPAPAEG